MGERSTVDGHSLPGSYAFGIGTGATDQEQLEASTTASYGRLAPASWETGPWPGVPFRWPRGYYQTVWDDRAAIRLLGAGAEAVRRWLIVGLRGHP